jgi:hypothetical protein
MAHLFLECPFAIQSWGYINIQIGQTLQPFQIMQSFKDQIRVPFFMKIIILMAWAIWKARNDLIFRGVNPSVHRTTSYFKEEMNLLLLRAKTYFPSIEQWIANLP